MDIVKHAREVDGKSTAIHAAILAPDDVTVYTYPCIPDYDNPAEQVWCASMAPLHKICVWTQIRKIKRNLIFNQNRALMTCVTLIFLICVQNANFMQRGLCALVRGGATGVGWLVVGWGVTKLACNSLLLLLLAERLVIQWTLVIKNTDITKSQYNKVIFVVPKFKISNCILLFLQPRYITKFRYNKVICYNESPL